MDSNSDEDDVADLQSRSISPRSTVQLTSLLVLIYQWWDPSLWWCIWETEFFARINDDGSEQPVLNDGNDDNIVEDETGDTEIVSKVKTFPEAVQALEDVAYLWPALRKGVL